MDTLLSVTFALFILSKGVLKMAAPAMQLLTSTKRQQLVLLFLQLTSSCLVSGRIVEVVNFHRESLENMAQGLTPRGQGKQDPKIENG